MGDKPYREKKTNSNDAAASPANVLVRGYREDGWGGTPVFIRTTTREQAIRWADALLENVKPGVSLLSELNDIQTDEDGKVVFESKWDIPLKLVNLILKTHGLYIEEK